MNITVAEIMSAKVNADQLLKSIAPSYIVPVIDNIKFTSANGYWAKIDKRNKKPNHYNLIIGNLLNLIPDITLRQKRLNETILHEMIHTLPGCFNHGSTFKKYCVCLNKKYGYSLQRTTGVSEYGIEVEHVKRKPKYLITCPHCGKQYHYTRKPVYDIHTYSCGRCGFSKLEIEALA